MSDELLELVEDYRDRHDEKMHEAIANRMKSTTFADAKDHQKTAIEHAHKAGVLDAVLAEYREKEDE